MTDASLIAGIILISAIMIVVALMHIAGVIERRK